MRTPFAKSMTAYLGFKTNELMAFPLRELAYRFALRDAPLGDVALGAVMTSSSNWNLARETVLDAGLSPSTPAYNLQRACGTSLEATAQIALKIAARQIEDGLAGGVDTNSDVSLELSDELRDALLHIQRAKNPLERVKVLSQIRPHHFTPRTPAVVEPKTGLSMGEHTERMTKEWKISRESQDELAYRSHLNGVAAYGRGFYSDLVAPFTGIERDTLLRADTTIEKLSKLKPVFDRTNGTLTAGNSSPLTDGAAAVLLASEEQASRRGWTPLARFVDAQSSAIDFVAGEGLLMAPTIAVGRLLERNGLTLQDFDYYEIHEAFAGQVLCTLKAWESDDFCRKHLGRSALGTIEPHRMNVAGGSVALGHPFAATGARIVATLAKLLSENRSGLNQRSKARGLISICTAGGMGVAAILEAV
jgi:acetyl-CoA C-acetyltransferase